MNEYGGGLKGMGWKNYVTKMTYTRLPCFQRNIVYCLLVAAYRNEGSKK